MSVLQNIYLMLGLLYKCNSLSTTSADGSIFKKIFKAITSEKSARKKLFLLDCYNNEIIINTKAHFYMTGKLFE